MARHLLHIGYPKAGSKFLQAWFELHPELRYQPGGLGGFRTVYEIARPSSHGAYKYYVTSDETLSSPNESAGGLPVEVSTLWMKDPGRIKKAQADVCAALKSLYPGSRVLIVTRGFKGLMTSGYSQYVRAGGVLHTSSNLPARVRDDAYLYAHHYFDFDYLLRLYADAFGEENLIVLPYELLRDDRDKFLASLEEGLGLGHVEVKLGRMNASLSPEELYWYPVISRAVLGAASRLGAAGFHRVYSWYVGQTLNNRLRLLVTILHRLRPDRRITEADFPDDILSYCAGKATRLKGRPLYAPYAAEYLWDS